MGVIQSELPCNITIDFATMQEKEQKISPIKQRILLFADSLGISKRDFYAKINVSRGTLESKTGITEDVMAKFIATYPDVSINWLITGEGNMLKEKEAAITPIAPPRYEILPISQLKTAKKLLNDQKIPLYNINARAGIVPMFKELSNNNPEGFIEIPAAPKCDGAIHITGDSMYPLLKAGDIILYKEINDIANNIFWGEMYLIAINMEGEEYLTVKYIQRSENPNYIKLVSQNSNHSDKEIPLASIRSLALVKASIRFNTMR